MAEPERDDELRDEDRDGLPRFVVGLVNGTLISFAIWVLLITVVLAAYQSAPSWVTTTVQAVLVAAR